MIRQKRPTQQYKLLQKEYDDVYKDIMLNGYDFSGPYTERCQEKLKEIRKLIIHCSHTQKYQSKNTGKFVDGDEASYLVYEIQNILES